jgi:hypothetical protein
MVAFTEIPNIASLVVSFRLQNGRRAMDIGVCGLALSAESYVLYLAKRRTVSKRTAMDMRIPYDICLSFLTCVHWCRPDKISLQHGKLENLHSSDAGMQLPTRAKFIANRPMRGNHVL